MLEALVAGGAQGLVLVRDSTACEGRSLLRAFASAAVQRAERVLVVLFDVPREQFEAGLSPSVKQRPPLPPAGAAARGPAPPRAAAGAGGPGQHPARPGGAPPQPRRPPARQRAQPPPRGGDGQAEGRELHPPARRLPALPGGAPPRAGGGGGGGGGGGAAAARHPQGFGGPGPPPHLPPAAVGGRAGGTGGRAPPVPAQPPQEVHPPPDARDHRLRPGAPRGRGSRGPRRRPGRVTTPPLRDIVGPT
ncbi:elongator complex protein 5 isoform X3 [Mycteria americana]|uniref:elongator complex protein 5 isoform X3 n=1 Tax=Mycteria americana TaxID=33587 RepID=UPI003F5831E3